MGRIKKERSRQLKEEGWTQYHDDAHDSGELHRAALCYQYGDPTGQIPDIWPWDRSWWKPDTEVRNLEKAGALYLAEADRLQRQLTRTLIGARVCGEMIDQIERIEEKKTRRR